MTIRAKRKELYMPVKKKTTKKTTRTTASKAAETDLLGDFEAPIPTTPKSELAKKKVTSLQPTEIIDVLNNTVSSLNNIFQKRDQLFLEVEQLKQELNIGNEMRLEEARLKALKREQEEFNYQFNIKKKRMEDELVNLEKSTRAQVEQLAENKENKLAAKEAEHAQRLRNEKEEHQRVLKNEKEDFEREKKLFENEKAVFKLEQKALAEEKEKMRERLIAELNMENEHRIKLADLDHQKQQEILQSELKLEKAHRSKFETLLAEAKQHNEKLAEQISGLSKEALASASSSNINARLKEIIGHVPNMNIDRSESR